VWTVKDLNAGDRRRLQASAAAIVSKSAGGLQALVKELGAAAAGIPGAKGR